LRYSAWTSNDLDRVGIYAGGLQARQQPLGEKVSPQTRNHLYRCTQLGNRDCLVGALTSVVHIEGVAKNGLPRSGEPVSKCNQVDVDATHYQQLLLHALPPFIARDRVLTNLNLSEPRPKIRADGTGLTPLRLALSKIEPSDFEWATHSTFIHCIFTFLGGPQALDTPVREKYLTGEFFSAGSG
jgi:hypothetical protein